MNTAQLRSEWLVIEECGAEQLRHIEQKYLDAFKPALNGSASAFTPYACPTEEMKAKRVAAIRARAAKITHCPHGHLYDEANTFIGKKGEKICRTCNRLRVEAIYAAETPSQKAKRRQAQRAYHEKNYDDRMAKQAAYAATHREEKRLYDKQRRARLGQALRDRAAAYRAAHKDERREYDRRRRVSGNDPSTGNGHKNCATATGPV